MGCGAADYERNDGEPPRLRGNAPNIPNPTVVDRGNNLSARPQNNSLNVKERSDELETLPDYERFVIEQIGDKTMITVSSAELEKYLSDHGAKCDDLGKSELAPVEVMDVIVSCYAQLSPDIAQFYSKRVDELMNSKGGNELQAQYTMRLREFGELSDREQEMFNSIDESGNLVINPWQLYVELKRSGVDVCGISEFREIVATTEMHALELIGPDEFHDIYLKCTSKE